MKKLSVFLPLCLSLFFFSCKSAPEPAPAPKPVTPEPEPVVKEEPPKPAVVEKPAEPPNQKKIQWLSLRENGLMLTGMQNGLFLMRALKSRILIQTKVFIFSQKIILKMKINL